MTLETATTHSFGEGKSLSSQLRAATPEQIKALTERLEFIHSTARDYVSPSPALRARVAPDGDVRLGMNVSGSAVIADTTLDFAIGNVAHEQFAEKLQIPRPYYRRMQSEAPGLLANNLNYWLTNDPNDYLLRTVEDRVRAVLSKRYRTLDNYDLFFHTYETARDTGGKLTQMDLTDSRLFMRLASPDFSAKITGRGADLQAKGKFFSSGYNRDNGTWQVADNDDLDGDWVFPMVVVSNSEVGRGGLNVELGMFRVTCTNLILVGTTLHKVHLGGERDFGIQIASDTQEAKDKAVWLEVRDLVKNAFNEELFRKLIAQANVAKSQVLAEPVEAVDTVVKHFGFSDEHKKAILDELVSPSFGGNPGVTTWGLINAVTALSHKVESFETGYDLARIGGDMFEKVPELVKIRK